MQGLTPDLFRPRRHRSQVRRQAQPLFYFPRSLRGSWRTGSRRCWLAYHKYWRSELAFLQGKGRQILVVKLEIEVLNRNWRCNQSAMWFLPLPTSLAGWCPESYGRRMYCFACFESILWQGRMHACTGGWESFRVARSSCRGQTDTNLGSADGNSRFTNGLRLHEGMISPYVLLSLCFKQKPINANVRGQRLETVIF